jgi:hypothetical protein
MAATSFDHLVNALASSKAAFWKENETLPEIEIQRLWQLRWNCLTSRVDGTSERHGSVIPSKRPVPRTLFGDGLLPSKRQELVGPPYPYPSVLRSDRISRARHLIPLSGKPRPLLELQWAARPPQPGSRRANYKEATPRQLGSFRTPLLIQQPSLGPNNSTLSTRSRISPPKTTCRNRLT